MSWAFSAIFVMVSTWGMTIEGITFLASWTFFKFSSSFLVSSCFFNSSCRFASSFFLISCCFCSSSLILSSICLISSVIIYSVILSFFKLHLSSLVSKIFPGCYFTTGTPIGYWDKSCCLVLDPLTLLERLCIVALCAAFISSNFVTDDFFVLDPIWEDSGRAVSFKDSRKRTEDKVSASSSVFNKASR